MHLASGAEGPLPKPIPEAALYPVIAAFFVAKGFSCWREASFLGSWIDVYGRDECGETVAVEAKVRDWKRALRQAQLVQNSADHVYVGLWAPFVHRALTKPARMNFERLGIGLLSVNGHCEVVIPAQRRRPRYPESVLTSHTGRVR